MKRLMIATVLLSVFSSMIVWSKEGPPPTIEQAAKTWVGYTSDELMFVRLQLSSDGSGFCATAGNPQTSLYNFPVHTYRVKQWKLEDRNLSFQIETANTNSEPIYLKGTFSIFTLNLEIGGTKNDWSQKLVLRPESNILIPNQDTKEAIDEMTQKKGGADSKDKQSSNPAPARSEK